MSEDRASTDICFSAMRSFRSFATVLQSASFSIRSCFARCSRLRWTSTAKRSRRSSYDPALPSSFATSACTRSCSSSTPSQLSSAICFRTAAISSLVRSSCSCALSAHSDTSHFWMALRSPSKAFVLSSAFATSGSTSPIDSAALSTSAMSATFCSSTHFLRSSALLRLMRLASSSRAMPTATLSCWNFAFGTPAPSPASCASILGSTGAGTAKPNSPLAYAETSFLLSTPSLSRSYRSNSWARLWQSFAALPFFRALPQTHRAVMVTEIISLKDSWMRSCSDRSSLLVSARTRFAPSMAGRFATTNSVHALQADFAPSPTFASVLIMSSASAVPSSFSSRAAGTASLSCATFCSAVCTSSPSSASRLFVVPSCSWRTRSSSSLFSSSFTRCSWMLSTRRCACSSCALASSRTRSAWTPHFGSSDTRASSISFFRSWKFSGVAIWTLWLTPLATRDACCSAAFLRSSSSRCLLSSSSCCRWRSASCCICCRLCSASCCCRSRASSCCL
mmetsp:Transcript_38354/g.108480  ORF Transcript_38354/g.108480 Transcript_38354/m.108480 type:complete len:508 (+) Transcript_38354:602-2125(+)